MLKLCQKSPDKLISGHVNKFDALTYTICNNTDILLYSILLYYIYNFFEQILAGLDPRYQTLDAPGDCGYYVYI